MELPKRQEVHFDDELILVGDTYYYRGTPEGHTSRKEISLKIKSGARQKDVLAVKKSKLEELVALGSAPGKKDFNSIVPKYIHDRELEAKDPTVLSPRTLRETKQIVDQYLKPFFGKREITEIDQSAFKDYCHKFKGQNLVNHRKVLSHFLKWCIHEKHLKYRHEIEIPKFARKVRRERVVLNEEQIKKLLKACEGKLLLYVLMYLFMGMRNMEICKLRWDEIDFEAKSLFVNPLNNRRRKARSIPINGFVLQILKQRRAEIKGAWVFPSAVAGSKFPYWSPEGGIRKSWEAALTKADLGIRIQPHDLRSTFETFMHSNPEFTDTQREKMAGAKIDVQKDIYVKMQAKQLKGLEESVQIEGVKEILNQKNTKLSGGNRGGKSDKKKPSQPAKARNHGNK